ncbi:porin [Motiliproteus coralliicola]|nr:porin [Motiliproteus coralliicola]
MKKSVSHALPALVAMGAMSVSGSVLAEAGPFTIYGTVEVRSVDRDDTDLDTFVDAARLGAKQSIKLDKFDDLEARWQIEFDLANNAGLGTDDRDVGDVGVRKAQINLKNGFGEAIFGRQNNLMAAAKKIDQFKNDSGVFTQGPDRVGNALSYVTPSFGPVNGFVQVISDVDADDSTPAEDADGYTLGLSVVGDSYDVQASYYEVDEDFDSGEVELTSLGGSVSLGLLGVFATYQNEEVTGNELMGLGASYKVEDVTFKAGYRAFDNDASQEGSAVHLLADYDLGEGVSAFVQYVEYDSDAETNFGHGDALSVGVAYNFSAGI